MAVFSVSQNRHLYVANAYSATVDDTSAVGTIGKVKVIGEGKEAALFISYKGPKGAMVTDKIQLANLGYAKAFAAADMVMPLKSLKVSLDANINGGLPVAGQDYVLRIDLQEWIGSSSIYEYYKDAVVHANSGMTAAQFYQKMVDSLNFCFAREIGANKTSNPYLAFSADASGITITEKEQEWSLGTERFERVKFDVQPTTIYYSTEDVIWAAQDATTGKYYQDLTPAKASATVGVDAMGNGKQIADLEWFCMGERGDQYRNMGWPNVIPTEYLVDASKEYNVLEFHHAFRDEGVNSYRSEKDITIVAEDDSVLNSLIGAINTAAATVDPAWANIATI